MMLHFRESDCRISQGSTWYDRMESLLMALGFIESKVDSNLFFKFEGRIPMMLPLYVDDIFLTGKEELIKHARRILFSEFKIKDLGVLHYFLGMKVW